MYGLERLLASRPASPPTVALHLLFFGSGATVLVHENSAHAFALVVAVLLVGLAAGASIARAGAAAGPVDGAVLAALGSEALGWRVTGAALADASRTPGPEGEAHVLDLLRTLPAPLRDALGVDDPGQ